MIIREIDVTEEIFQSALDLRYQLFYKEHDLPYEIMRDSIEKIAKHIAIIENGSLVAYGRVHREKDNNFAITQMVVSPSHQIKEYGTNLLETLMAAAIEDGALTITLDSRLTAREFYQKFGFKKIGQVFNSKTTGIKHIKMIYHKNA